MGGKDRGGGGIGPFRSAIKKLTLVFSKVITKNNNWSLTNAFIFDIKLI